MSRETAETAVTQKAAGEEAQRTSPEAELMRRPT